MFSFSLSGNEFNPNLLHPYYIIRSGLFLNIKLLSKHISGDILDFGCGSKPYKSIFKCNRYVGVDFENPGHSHENENIDFYYNGKELPFGDSQFDAILCSEVFEHVFNLDEILKELYRVLKPDGVILITCPFVWKEHELPNDFARYTHFALRSLLNKSGFSEILSIKSGNYLDVLLQLYILFFNDHVYPYFNKYLLTRLPFKIIFFLVPNIFAYLLKGIRSIPNSLYLNNVVLYKKVK
jgi:SAM-dependent methyltransferase